MATLTTQSLTLEEFRTRYQHEKPYYEYWFGEAIQKPVRTWLHILLQRLLANALDQAGYNAGSELELRVDEHWQPLPDVMGTLQTIERYPTQPVEIVVEVLSPGDGMPHVMRKCEHYHRNGTEQIFVMEPEQHKAWQWLAGGRLNPVSHMQLPNGKSIDLSEIWRELDSKSRKKPADLMPEK